MHTHVAIDLDGTLTREELLPLIARRAGVASEMAELTRDSVAGLVDPEISLRSRVNLLAAVTVDDVVAAVETVPFFDELSDLVRSLGTRASIVTANLDSWIVPLVSSRFPATRLFCSEAIEERGRVVGIRRYLNKGDAIREIRRLDHGATLLAVGEGANDVAMIHAADVGVAFYGVHRPAETAIAAADFLVRSESRLCDLIRQL